MAHSFLVVSPARQAQSLSQSHSARDLGPFSATGESISGGVLRAQTGAVLPWTGALTGPVESPLRGSPNGSSGRRTAVPALLETSGGLREGLRSTTYLHHGRRVLSLTAGLACLPVGLALGVPVAVINAVYYRDPRLVFFRQARVGRDGRVFKIWKFRTMRDDPEELAEARTRMSGGEFERYEFERWSEGRGEVTRLGRFLRDTHLDELPQLLNVLFGDMDLVGPRPEMYEVHRWAKSLIPGFYRRNQARPGITGLAQLKHGYAGKNEEAYRRKLDADLEYIGKASLLVDAALMLQTVSWVVGSKLRRNR